jgi:hypothetical protein
MFRVRVELHVDRNRSGSLNVLDEDGRTVMGPFAVAGRASDALADANGNAGRDPNFLYGDTPTGVYRVTQVLGSGSGTTFPAAEFGPHGVIVLEGVSGKGAIAEANGRFHLLIQAGRLAPSGELRATAGALRLANDDIRKLAGLLRDHSRLSCEVGESVAAADMGRVFDDGSCTLCDPQPLGAQALTVANPSLSRREALLSGGAGAMTFGFSVTFVGLEGVSPARAYTRLAYGPQSNNGNGALDQLKALNEGGATNGTQPVVDTPATTPPPVDASGTGSSTDKLIVQQREINAIQAEKPPANASSDQLKTWDQDKQQRIQKVLNGTH